MNEPMHKLYLALTAKPLQYSSKPFETSQKISTWFQTNSQNFEDGILSDTSFPESACEGFFAKTTAVVMHLHTLTSADLHLHTLTSADLHLHIFTSADLHADLHLHIFTSADLHLHSFTSDLHSHPHIC